MPLDGLRLDYARVRELLRERLGVGAAAVGFGPDAGGPPSETALPVTLIRPRARRAAAPPPRRILMLTGARQVGKSTLLTELARDVGARALYAACDGAEAATPGYWERLWARAEELSQEHGSSVLLLDEVSQVGNWAERLKAEWDRARRRRLEVRVVATASSALRIGSNARKLLGPRAEWLELGQWSARGLVEAFGVSLEEAVDSVVRLGAYPGTVGMRHDYARWCAYVRDGVIEPALGEIMALGVVRRPALLRQLFALCVASPAEVVALQKLRAQLQEPAALGTVAQYLRLLEEAYLVVALDKYAPRGGRRRAAPPKIVVLSNALLGATDPRGFPTRADDPDRRRAWIANACLAHAWGSGQRVTYWREEPFEVDAVIEGSWGKLVVAVRPGSYDATSLRGLREFSRRFPRYIAKVLCDQGEQHVAERAGLEALPWRQFVGLEGS
ncbi:MAG: ATP-binding protein [Polyangiaceae bacterium]|nr:ATP-binding protein [Polyangiaceae bacterium]